MMGNGEQPGLIPRLCCSLFERVHAEENEAHTFKVEVSYMEIYNEKVRDLLDPKGWVLSSVRPLSLTRTDLFPLGWSVVSSSLGGEAVTEWCEQEADPVISCRTAACVVLWHGCVLPFRGLGGFQRHLPPRLGAGELPELPVSQSSGFVCTVTLRLSWSCSDE